MTPLRNIMKSSQCPKEGIESDLYSECTWILTKKRGRRVRICKIEFHPAQAVESFWREAPARVSIANYSIMKGAIRASEYFSTMKVPTSQCCCLRTDRWCASDHLACMIMVVMIPYSPRSLITRVSVSVVKIQVGRGG